MGRPARKTGHLAGTFAPPSIQPSQSKGPCRLSSIQPVSHQPPQPQVSIPISHQSWQTCSPHYDVIVPEAFTPSTTEALSPVSSRATLSPGITSAGTSYTEALRYARHFSPDATTPNSSATSTSSHQEFHHATHASQQHMPLVGQTGASVWSSDHAMREIVMGIEHRAPFHETAHYLAHSPVFLTTKDPSPTRHQRYPATIEPWSIYPLRQDDQYVGYDTSSSDAMDYTPDVVQTQTTREKGGGRTGPLSQGQRQHASEVRKKGACLRCSIMKEKCDLQNPCNTCSRKDRRKAPKTCIAKHFDWDDYRQRIFPNELTSRLQAGRLFSDLATCTFKLSDRPCFQIPLDMHIGINLSVTVKEFDPLQSGPDIRHAYEAIRDAHGNTSLGQQPHWNPPIIMRIKKGDLTRQWETVQMEVSGVFDKVLGDPKAWAQWTTMYFYYEAEDFQRDILELIGRYYRKDLRDHDILKTALSLLWFEYLLVVKFTIPRKALRRLETSLEAPRPRQPFGNVIPETINRFLKAIILPMAEEAAQKLTEYLHDLLFKMALTPKTSTTGQHDIALCLLLILDMFLSRTQATLLLLADIPTEERDMEYTIASAEKTIRKMESVADHFASLHKYTLSRISCRSPATPAGVESPFEAHARDFDLSGHLRQEIATEYAHQRPSDLKLGTLGKEFRYTNVRRQCWRILGNMASHS